jgi:hypothetical protein
MGGFFDGLGFLIRLGVLLFTWLAVAIFASRELAAVMGLVVIALWVMFFLPLNFLREMAWQKRQKMTMQAALAHSPKPYEPGSALPPPPVGGGLVILNTPSSGSSGALDVYRELPSLPPLEPRTHALSFWRSLSLPIIGMLMFLGASNDTFMHMLLESRGMMHKAPIAWENIYVPPPLKDMFEDRHMEMESAARMTLRREGSCASIVSGRVEALNQFSPPAQQLEQIRDEQFVYVFDCLADPAKPAMHMTWISPDEISPGNLDALLQTFTRALAQDAAYTACAKAANELMAPMQGRLGASRGIIRYDGARPPYSGSARLISAETMLRANGTTGNITLNCWVNSDGQAVVRLGR